MECACVAVDTDYGHDSFHRSCKPIARKTHKCCECYREIKKGEQYSYECGAWEGVFSTYKVCADCLSLRDAFFCDGWVYEGLWEYMNEHINDCGGDISQSCIAELTKPARDKVCDLIEEHWGE